MKQQPSSDLTPKQAQVAAAVASGVTLRKAAAEAGVAERTAQRWMAEHGVFRAEVVRLRDEMIGETVGILSRVSSAAAVELAKLLKDEESTVRLRAATAILDHTIRVREHAQLAAELVEFGRRLEALEGIDADSEPDDDGEGGSA